MSYKSLIPLNAPSVGNSPDTTIFRNDQNLYTGSKYSKKIQAASCIVEEPTPVIENSFYNNGFLSAIHSAFSKHLPILIIPDDIWHVYMSQLSLIVNKNPEQYQNYLVDFSGKKEIEIINDNLIMDVVNKFTITEWGKVFPAFEAKMNKNTKIDTKLLFTTTTNEHYIVSRILIMETMKKFFNYRVKTRCGFPEIRIGGTVDDWNKLRLKIEEICNKLKILIGHYSIFITECIKIIEGKGSPDYWEKLYHIEGSRQSGQTEYTTGIINSLFPIDTEGNYAPGLGLKRDIKSFPPVYGKVDFIWIYLGSEYKCIFEGGLSHVGWDNKLGHLYCKPTWTIYRLAN